MRRGLSLLPLLAACALPGGAGVAFRTIDGSPIDPLHVAPGRVRVLLFVAHECPIANSYAPAIEALWRELRGTEVDCLLVHCDPDLDAAAALAHGRDYALSLPTVLDPEQQLARAVGATITPEAAVLTVDGLQYLGRIDDRWRGFGKDSQQAEHDDLRNAIAAVRQGRPVAAPRTQAVGCRLPEPRR